jgi:hypothetical protein
VAVEEVLPDEITMFGEGGARLRIHKEYHALRVANGNGAIHFFSP